MCYFKICAGISMWEHPGLWFNMEGRISFVTSHLSSDLFLFQQLKLHHWFSWRFSLKLESDLILWTCYLELGVFFYKNMKKQQGVTCCEGAQWEALHSSYVRSCKLELANIRGHLVIGIVQLFTVGKWEANSSYCHLLWAQKVTKH